ncbi:MAG: gliding motility-associated C-terminal domain-containing protein [Saprospiraceae bacterium]
MKNCTALAALLLLVSTTLFAQPQPCGPNPEMTPVCANACIICDINGFTGINNAGIVGQAPPGFCTGTVHHMQWIGFIAGSASLTLSISVFNCQNGAGLEVGIYKSLDCQTFQLVSNCDGGIPPNTTQNFTNITPLTIGQYYYFVMDGNNNDVCSYTIHVVNGTTEVMPLDDSGNIIGPETVCASVPNDFTVSLPPGAAHFYWTLNGLPYASETDTTVSLNFLTPGLNQLCVTASNACDTAFPACRNIFVHSIPPTDITAKICTGECYEVADTMLCDAGDYEFHFVGANGCDSLVRVSLEMLQAVTTNLNIILCDGDSIFVGSQPYFQSGQFQEALLSPNGCDSIVNLALQIIQCEIQGQITANPVVCHGEPSGSLQFSVANGTPPFTYSWEQIGGGGAAGTGTIAALNTLEQIPNLSVGTYSILVKDNFGNDVVFLGDVTEPSVLAFSFEKSDFKGFNIRCNGEANGSIGLSLAGGVPAYTFSWSNGVNAANLQNLPAGIYTCTATDALGCSLIRSIELLEPPALAFEARFKDPGCGGPNTGEAYVSSIVGGTPAYLFALSGNDFGTTTDFENLSPGHYTLTAQDANGCESTASATLPAPLIPNIELGQDLTVNLAESTQILLAHDTPLDSFAWSLHPGLSCYHCPQPFATPFETTTYTLTAEAPGGCTDTDSLTVFVLKIRDVYIPNVFSPNDDGANDLFSVFGGPEVKTVKLEVYSRWGELVFRKLGLSANDEAGGWDGTFRGHPVSPGVFAYRAEILFVDGATLQYEGDVTLLR